MVETTMVGTVLNGLSHVAGAASKAAFVCGMIRGLGGNLPFAARNAFAKEVFAWAGERPPDLSRPLDCRVDGSSFVSFVSDTELEGELSAQPVLKVPTHPLEWG